MSSLASVIEKHVFSYYSYADDTTLPPTKAAYISACLTDISCWTTTFN